jgi:hypothetical protein
MVAINKILLPQCAGERCGGRTRNPPREARLHACSPVHFLLSPFCRRSRDRITCSAGISLYGFAYDAPTKRAEPRGLQ